MNQSELSKRVLYLFAVPIFVLCAGCEREMKITNGDFHGVSIGMSKDSVRSALSQQGIEVIYPVVDDNIILKNPSKNDLHELDSSSGICMGNGSGFEVQVAFDKNDMSKLVYSSAQVDPVALGISSPQTRQEMMKKIGIIIDSTPHMIVSNCILDVKSINVKDSSRDDVMQLQRFNSWFYYIPHGHSTATLRFTDGNLVEVDYVYRRYETP